MGPNNFPLPTSDQTPGQNADFIFTQWDDVSLDDLNLSLYQFDNTSPHVLSQESEYVSSVYPALLVQEQSGQAVETSVQLGPEIQTLELHANGSGQDRVREHSKRNHRISEINSISISSWVRITFHYPPVTTHPNRVPVILQLKEFMSRSITPTYLQISSTVHLHKYHHRSRHQVLTDIAPTRFGLKLLMLQSLQDIHGPRNYKIRRISGMIDVPVGGPALTLTATKHMGDPGMLFGTKKPHTSLSTTVRSRCVTLRGTVQR